MTYSLRIPPEKLHFYATSAYDCSYVAGRTARSQVAAPSDAINAGQYSLLIAQGFRRSGTFVYRPYCDQCRACLSIRVPVEYFKPNRSQQRAWKQHASLSCSVLDPTFSEEHFALYMRYQRVRHTGGGMDVEDRQQYADFLVSTHVQSVMVEFRQQSPNVTTSELKMVSIIDRVNDGLSAVYTFYSPEHGQNLGTFNVLWQIQQAKILGLRYVYLGYWIESCDKMSYKSRFKPCELLVEGKWQSAR